MATMAGNYITPVQVRNNTAGVSEVSVTVKDLVAPLEAQVKLLRLVASTGVRPSHLFNLLSRNKSEKALLKAVRRLARKLSQEQKPLL